MALSVTHAFVSAIADGGDATLVQPSNWNAAHTLTGVTSVAQGGTALSTFVLGDILYSSAANTLAALAGNTTSAKQFLTQTGTGTVSAAPAWGALAGTDLPAFVASGASHAQGAVPDPGAAAGTTKFLCENATWAVPAGGGTPGGASLTIQYNNSSAFAGMSGTSWDDTNRSLTLTGATVTTSNPVFNLTQTWNAAGVAFAALKLNVTNTASAAGSLLADLQVGGTSIYSIRKDGVGILSNATTATALWVYNTVDTPASPTNYERGVFDWTTTANVLTIGTQAAGTGTARTLRLVSAAANLEWTSANVKMQPSTDPGGNTLTYSVGSGNSGIGGDGAGGSHAGFRVFVNNGGLFNVDSTGIYSMIGQIGFSTGINSANDVGLARNAAGVLEVNNGTAGTLTGSYLHWGGQARVTADFTVSNSTVLTNVTGLSVTVAAGRTYTFETELFVTDAAAGGVQAAIAGTATATAIQYTGYTIADNAIKAKTNATALATAVGSTTTTETSGIVVRITGTITVNAGGTLTVQMAQNTSNATATVAKRGSYFIVHDMP